MLESRDVVTHPRTHYAVLRSTTVVQYVFGRQYDDDAGGCEVVIKVKTLGCSTSKTDPKKVLV